MTFLMSFTPKTNLADLDSFRNAKEVFTEMGISD
jgi:hypothetical protein